ncbi:MAG: nitroreductase family protein [Promethearchaeota archaeon]
MKFEEVMTVDVLDSIKERRSIRRFKKKDIEEEKISILLEAMRWAPSAGNRQPWEFIIIKNKELLSKIASEAPYGAFIADAPLAIAIVTDPETSRWHIVDGSLASQNLQLAAWAMGLGTCWIGSMDREPVKKILGIPEGKHLLTIFPLGYPDEKPVKNRKSLDLLVHNERYSSD